MAPLQARPSRAAPKLLGRQRQLLHLLDALGGSVKRQDFEHLLFLYCQEQPAGALYDFVPHRVGACSLTAQADQRKLSEIGLLEDGEAWAITEAGRNALGHARDLSCAASVRRHRNLRGDALLADVFRRFPFWGTRSAVAPQVLRDDASALMRVEEARWVPLNSALSTIGYEGHSIESYLCALLRHGVTVLCDVRRNPLSRKPGFSKGPLSRACAEVGIRYEHLPELGIASEQRQGLETRADYDALFAEYAEGWLPLQEAAIQKIVEWIQSGERVALTCYEREVMECHRGVVAEVLQERLGMDVGVL